MIAILSDTHLPRGGRTLPARCLEILRSATLVVHAGDFTSGPVLADLEQLGPPLLAVHGNVDDPQVRERLPERATGEAEGLRVGVVHDAGPSRGRHDRLGGWFPGCDLIVYGHTHLPEIAWVGGAWIVNPGSPTERRRAPSHTLVVVEAGVPSLVEL